MMLGFYITAKGFTQERYDTTLVQLQEAGAGAPDGRISHVALETDGEIQVFDVWESQEAFERIRGNPFADPRGGGRRDKRADGGSGSQRDQRLIG